MNKQPHYHRCTIMFTATEEYTQSEVENALKKLLAQELPTVLSDTVIVEEMDEIEYGDPHDLM